MKPFYQDNLTTLYQGDCLDIMPHLAAQSFDAVVADLPFGTTDAAWDSVIPFDAMWANLKCLVKPRGAIVLFGSEPYSSTLRMSNLDWYKYDWVWHKSRPTGFLDANRKPLNDHELLSMFAELQPTFNPQMWKGIANHVANGRPSGSQKASQYGTYRNLVRYQTDEKYPRKVLPFPSLDPAQMLHPTQKPLELMEYLVKTYTNEGDAILDFTAGSGTTLRAAKNLKRRSVGIELLEEYCQVAVKRLAPAFEEALIDDSTLDDLPLFAQEHDDAA